MNSAVSKLPGFVKNMFTLLTAVKFQDGDKFSKISYSNVLKHMAHSFFFTLSALFFFIHIYI